MSRGAEARRRKSCRRLEAERRLHPRLQPLGARRRNQYRRPQLTTDGVKDFGYATDNAGWTQAATGPIVVWSPDSKAIATFQQDQRGVGEMYLVETQGGPSDAAGAGSIRCPATRS